MDQRYHDQEVEIDLLDLLYNVALKWRVMIIAAILFALLGGGYQLYKNDKTNQLVDAYEEYNQLEKSELEDSEKFENVYESQEASARKAALESVSEDKVTFSELKESEIRDFYRLADAQLSDDQLKTVDDAVYMYGSLLDREKYEEESIWINLNYERVGTGFALYHVDTGHTTNYAGITEDNYREALRDAYVAYINNSSEIPGIDWSDNIRYIRELFSVHLTSDGNISIYTYAENEEKAKELVDAIGAMLESYTPTLKRQIGNHKVIKINELYDTQEVLAVKDARDDAKNDTNSYRSSMNSYYKGFNIYQAAKFHFETLKQYGKTPSFSDILSKNETYVKTYKKNSSTVPVRVYFTRGVKKMIVLGGAGGVFLIALVFASLYIIDGKVKSGNEISEKYGVYLIGDLDAFHYVNPKRRFFIDRWIYSWKNRKKRTEEECKDYIVANSCITCRSAETKKVVITSVEELDEKAMAVAESVKKGLVDAGIDASISCDILTNAKSIEEVSNSGRCILMGQIGKTRRADVLKAAEFIYAQKIKVLGAISL